MSSEPTARIRVNRAQAELLLDFLTAWTPDALADVNALRRQAGDALERIETKEKEEATNMALSD